MQRTIDLFLPGINQRNKSPHTRLFVNQSKKAALPDINLHWYENLSESVKLKMVTKDRNAN